MRSCRKCGAPIPVQAGAGRPRVMCTSCRPPRGKSAMSGKAAEARVTRLRGSSRAPLTVEQASRVALEEAGKATYPVALLVLTLARSLDAGGHSGASLASLSREYRAALAAALVDEDDAGAEDDGVAWDVG